MELKDNKIFNRAITIALAKAMEDLVIANTPMSTKRVWIHTLEVFRLMYRSVANVD